MHAQVVSINVSSDRQCFEGVDEELINFFFELLEDFEPKGEVLSHGTALVISSEHDDALRVVELAAVSMIRLTFKQ